MGSAGEGHRRLSAASPLLVETLSRPGSEQPERFGLLLRFRRRLASSVVAAWAVPCWRRVPLPSRRRGFHVGRVQGFLLPPSFRARATTAGNSSASPNRSGSSKDSMCGSAEGRCTPMVARPPRIDSTTFSSSEDSASAVAACSPASSALGNVGFLSSGFGVGLRFLGGLPVARVARRFCGGELLANIGGRVVRRFLSHTAEEELFDIHHVRAVDFHFGCRRSWFLLCLVSCTVGRIFPEYPLLDLAQGSAVPSTGRAPRRERRRTRWSRPTR